MGLSRLDWADLYPATGWTWWVARGGVGVCFLPSFLGHLAILCEHEQHQKSRSSSRAMEFYRRVCVRETLWDKGKGDPALVLYDRLSFFPFVFSFACDLTSTSGTAMVADQGALAIDRN